MENIGLINYNVSKWPMEKLLSWCADNGVGWVELMRPDVWEDVSLQNFKAKDVSALLDKYGIKVSQISCGNDFIQPDGEEFRKQVEIVSTLCRVIKDMGFNSLRIDGGWPKESVEEDKYVLLVTEGIKRVVEIAEKEQVYLALDNHGKVTNDYKFQLDIFREINSKYLGANLDTMNYRWYGYTVEELPVIYREIAPYTFHTHIKDGVMKERFKYEKRVLGEGEVPLGEAFKILVSAGYKGPWCIEYEGADGMEGYRKSVEWLKKI